jgi:hypothetical protein
MRVFRDTDAVLRYAYAMAEMSVCKVSDAQRAMAGASATNKSADGALSPHDQHAQAAMIRNHVNRLPPLARAYGWTVFSWSDERANGLAVLDDFIARETKLVNSRMRQMLIRRYTDLGRKNRPTHELIATKSGVHKRTVQRYETAVAGAMDGIRAQFYEHLDTHFARAGLIPS